MPGLRPAKRKPIYHADCIEIVLTQGYSTFVDLDCPADILARTWSTHRAANRIYAAAGVRENGVDKTRKLHRMLLGEAADGMDIDHIDRDTLNNRRANLRVCTRRQNMANITTRGKFRGVAWVTRAQRWQAQLKWRDTNGQQRCKHVGYYDTAEEAARAWDAAALASGLYDPEFLRLNFGRVTEPVAQ